MNIANIPCTEWLNISITPDFQAVSPDEKALIDAAARVGFTYLGVDDTVEKSGEEYNIHLVRFETGKLNGRQNENAKVMRYRVDAIIDFDSVRKRMSVMVRERNGRYFVYTKGAEVAMLDPKVRSLINTKPYIHVLNLMTYSFVPASEV